MEEVLDLYEEPYDEKRPDWTCRCGTGHDAWGASPRRPLSYEIEDGRERRVAVAALHLDGWSVKAIASCLSEREDRLSGHREIARGRGEDDLEGRPLTPKVRATWLLEIPRPTATTIFSRRSSE
jgi:hypothetical protein